MEPVRRETLNAESRPAPVAPAAEIAPHTELRIPERRDCVIPQQLRIGVFEVLEMTEAVRRLIGSQTDSGSVEDAAIDAGMVTMIEDAVAKCRAGVTSAAEVLRVTTVR